MFLALFLLVAKVCLYAVVQFLSRIVSHLLLTIVNGCGLYDDGQDFLPGRIGMLWQTT